MAGSGADVLPLKHSERTIQRDVFKRTCHGRSSAPVHPKRMLGSASRLSSIPTTQPGCPVVAQDSFGEEWRRCFDAPPCNSQPGRCVPTDAGRVARTFCSPCPGARLASCGASPVRGPDHAAAGGFRSREHLHRLSLTRAHKLCERKSGIARRCACAGSRGAGMRSGIAEFPDGSGFACDGRSPARLVYLRGGLLRSILSG